MNNTYGIKALDSDSKDGYFRMDGEKATLTVESIHVHGVCVLHGKRLPGPDISMS